MPPPRAYRSPASRLSALWMTAANPSSISGRRFRIGTGSPVKTFINWRPTLLGISRGTAFVNRLYTAAAAECWSAAGFASRSASPAPEPGRPVSPGLPIHRQPARLTRFERPGQPKVGQLRHPLPLRPGATGCSPA